MDVPPKERDKRTEAGSELLSCSPAPVLGSFVNQRRSEILFWFKRSTIAQKAGWQQEQPVSSSTPPGGEPNIVPYVCFPALHPACFPSCFLLEAPTRRASQQLKREPKRSSRFFPFRHPPAAFQSPGSGEGDLQPRRSQGFTGEPCPPCPASPAPAPRCSHFHRRPGTFCSV